MRALVLGLTILVLAAPAASAQAPPVADVGGTPIAQADFDHWLRIAHLSAQGPRPVHGRPLPRPGTKQRRELTEQVMQLLVQNAWVLGEAALQGVSVSERTVDRLFRFQRQQTGLDDPKAWRAFLRDSGFTAADVRFRVRLEELSNRLRERVVGGWRHPELQQTMLDAFIADFSRRWRSVTVCRKAYATKDCGRTIP